MAALTYEVKVKPYIKAASILLQRIVKDNNDAETMEIVEKIKKEEEEENTDFFLASLDGLIRFCEELKKDVFNESKQ